MRQKEIPLLSPKPFDQFTALEFVDYIKSIRLVSTSKTLSKSIEGVFISNGKRLITKVTKTKTEFTDAEIDALCAEFKVEKETLITNLMKKKLVVLDEHGQPRAKAKRDAKPRKTSKRKAKGKDKLLESGSDSDLQEKSVLQPSEGTQE